MIVMYKDMLLAVFEAVCSVLPLKREHKYRESVNIPINITKDVGFCPLPPTDAESHNLVKYN
jgi:hypothetical protein